jgi:hypothetical protein
MLVERETPSTPILLAVEMDAFCTSILLAVEGDAPCTSILLLVEMDTLYSAALLAVGRDTPYTSILQYMLAAEMDTSCAANFSFAQLAKRKSLGRSKSQLIPKHKHCNTLSGMFLLYPSLTELPSIEIN